MSNYPPGMSINDPHLMAEHECPRCDSTDIEIDYEGTVYCCDCGFVLIKGNDPDRKRDERREQEYRD